RCYADAQVSFMSSSVSTCELNLGVDDHSAGSHFQLFPDPGGDGFEVRSSQPIQAVAVRDAAGRMFLTKPGGSLVHVPAVQWPAGCYLVAAEFGNGTRAVRKWIKP
ncbi:MAG: T9SS type A sorting domain-containing protein, partial [Flavobacteriales bacterium]|nr:T9SS type A sorting domain-containing protein [Flavobacteriales bacterium]